MTVAFILISMLVAAAVLVHFEALNQLTLLIPKLDIKHRLRVLVGVFGALLAHVIEIWLFAFGYYLMVRQGGFGSLQGHFDGSLMDCVYFSLVNYTSLGFGDIVPRGDIRFLAGIEALTGLVLITWTASFMFIEMQKLWKDQ
ncbi:MAG: potassium channel family protein [Methylotenera sp.]|nr:potassium channel family protein [Methylotenera sp.]MDO9232386.1 potassium channel family protein [Methylotenera sp.]MDO9389374.1 potassium channel family protein [Methylotenera sp.]MDP1597198.1 potassium channel family protein [Methylotenera sp.]MDP1754526.1 potassium channel family protein [Methylotenera sp.]